MDLLMSEEKTFYILCGLPASGKSLFREKTLIPQCHCSPFFVYSTDDVIEQFAVMHGMTYDKFFMVENAFSDAKMICEKRLKKALSNEYPVIIWDQTNLRRSKRKKLIRLAHKNNYRVVVYYFPVYSQHYSEWLDRLESREGKTIPNDVLSGMVETFQKPSADNEDIDELHVIDTFS